MTIVTLREDVKSKERVVEEQTIVAQPKNVQVEQAGDGALSLTWEDAEGDKDGKDVKEKSIAVSWTIAPGEVDKYILHISDKYRTWEHPSEVDHYGISISHSGREIRRYVMSPSSREYLFENLTPGRLYTLSSPDQRSVQINDLLTGGRLYELVVVAVSGDRRSLPTRTNHRTKVHRPEGLHVADVKLQQITITWEHAPGDKDAYTAAVFDTTRQDRTPKSKSDVSATALVLEHRFSALVPGREYEILVTTISGGDTSEPDKRIVRTKPLRPVNVRTSAVDSGIKVDWSEPSGDKDEYLLEISPSEDNEVEETSIRITWRKPDCHMDMDCYHVSIHPAVGVENAIGVVEREKPLEYTFKNLTSGRKYTLSVATASGGDRSDPVTTKKRTT
ncbi:PREDICTED: receptor-type tyrosine-protein phosphatase beta-like, partial [Branchiostoma belcheri]|uniref:Receptor-type tyrosine-protein phosphatase beta-like n=1 Tax=Branchiostoma belcheri TaxID=7741 RepID=A0A6P4Z769_BRABE